MYHFENLDFEQIAAALGISQTNAVKLHNEAMVILKHKLADRVRRRWPGRVAGTSRCPICDHPKRDQIEKIVAGKKTTESWGTINKRLKSSIGRIFHPPTLLINHQKYHKKG
jgi:hypothetical protein